LKCIVARISHSCELVPKGLYKVGEENPSIIDFEEEFKLPEVAELNSLEAWAHLNPNILNQGRCSHYIDPKLTEEQKEAATAELAEKDPIIERLKGIAEDKPYEVLGFAANWANSIAGETVPVNQIGKQ
jgi:radial spoke head protein 4/6